MARDAAVFGVAVLLVLVGLLILLAGAAGTLGDLAVPAGGGVVLVGVGIITGYIMRLPHSGPEGDHWQ